MSPASTFLLGIASVALALACVWAVQLRTKNAGMVDPVWSWSLAWLGILYAACGSAPAMLRILLAITAGLWGLRLGTHLFLRNRGRPEDGRYKRFRDQWGAKADRNMFWFFQFQTVFAALLSLPFLVIAWRDELPPMFAIVAAIAIWIAAVAGEGIADSQLERFKKDPVNKGRVCRSGLWRYSRHPNYFFECLHWFTYVLLAVGSPWWWATLIAPMVMAFLLLKLSGIPITEAQTAKTRPDYAEYIRTTSAFIPWPPREDRTAKP